MSLRKCIYWVGMSLFVASASLVSTGARADLSAVTGFTLGNTDPSGTYTLGWTFTPTANVTVTGLGWWDKGNDGLLASHDLGIWSVSGGPALGTATVGAGLSGTLDNGFRYAAPGSPFNLLANQTYVIGGVSDGGDEWAYNVTNKTMSPDITFGESRFDVNSTPLVLQLPSSHYAPVNDAYYGPNFKYTLTGGASVPEPGTYAMGAGMLIAGVMGFRRRRAVAANA